MRKNCLAKKCHSRMLCVWLRLVASRPKKKSRPGGCSAVSRSAAPKLAPAPTPQPIMTTVAAQRALFQDYFRFWLLCTSQTSCKGPGWAGQVMRMPAPTALRCRPLVARRDRRPQTRRCIVFLSFASFALSPFRPSPHSHDPGRPSQPSHHQLDKSVMEPRASEETRQRPADCNRNWHHWIGLACPTTEETRGPSQSIPILPCPTSQRRRSRKKDTLACLPAVSRVGIAHAHRGSTFVGTPPCRNLARHVGS